LEILMNQTVTQPSSAIKIHSLDEYLSKDESLVWAFSRVLAAIALDHKGASPAELDVLMEFARQSASPALVGSLIFSAIEANLSLGKALKDLQQLAAKISPEQRDAAFRSALPLIELQGQYSSEYKKKLAQALGDEHLAFRRSESVNWGILDSISDDISRRFRERDFADDVLEFAQSMGDLYLLDAYRRYRKKENIDLLESVRKVTNCLESVERGFNEKKHDSSAAATFLKNSNEFVDQVKQRLLLLDARIRLAKSQLAEEIDEIVSDVGAAMESGTQDRTMTDDWSQSQVWESMGRLQYGLLAERKINRVILRLNEDIRLFERELSLFRSEVSITVEAIIRNEHYSRFDGLERPLRILTIVEETAHEFAEKTLIVTAIGIAGVGAAAIALGPATVVPVLVSLAGPTALKIGTFIVGTGLFKWFSSPESRRKYSEIKSKRKAFEAFVRDRLEDARNHYELQLDQIYLAFEATAVRVATPVALEAEAMARLPVIKRRVLEQSITRSRESLGKLTIGASPFPSNPP
jgi:hypothetical protein